MIATVKQARQHHSESRTPPRVLTCWLGEYRAREARRRLNAAGLASYQTPEEAVAAILHLIAYRDRQAALMQVPQPLSAPLTPDLDGARRICETALAQDRHWLTEVEAKRVLAAYGIPVVPTEIAATPEQVASRAQAFLDGQADAVAIKIHSPDITHKSDMGGVALGLETATEAAAAAQAMATRIRKAAPKARLEGFAVQPMVRTADAVELILGMTVDASFGPVILFGRGGTAVEVLRDQALALPPLNSVLAEMLIDQTAVARLLKGYRDRPPADRNALVETLIKLSRLAVELPEVVELDINPLLAASDGVVALDARIRIGDGKGRQRLAISPYPKALETDITTRSGARYHIRPIRPEDAPLLQALVARMDPHDLRLRFFSPLRELPIAMAAKLTQIDYDREMALVALDPADRQRLMGIVRIAADPDNQRAEYAVMVDSKVKGQGLGYALMQRILIYAKTRGIGEVFGEVLRENTSMIRLCKQLGFSCVPVADEPGILRVNRVLGDLASSDAHLTEQAAPPTD